VWYRTCHFRMSEVGATMLAVEKSFRLKKLGFALVLLALGLTVGCSHSSISDENPNSAKDQHQIPFQEANRSADLAGAKQSQGLSGESANADLPFAAASAVNLPVGTLLSVRLKDTLSSSKSGADSLFTAALAEAVIVDGNTVAARGTMVRGRVESVRASYPASLGRGNRAVVRLTLVSIHADGRDVPLQTSSLFVRGRDEAAGAPVKTAFSIANDSSRGVQIQKGRLLVFRLASAISVPVPDTTHVSKNSPPNSQ
jgi:hypothetical protein